MPIDGTPAKTKKVMDVKGSPKKEDPGIQIHTGNISILTIKMLEAINKNLITITQQNAKLIKMVEEAKEEANG